MRSRALCFVLAFVFLSCVIVFSGGSIKASADVEITKVSALTGRSFFGDSISATYYRGSSPYSITFSYFDSFSNPGVGLNVDSSSIIPTPVGMAQYDFVVYRALIPNDYSAFVDRVVFNDFYLRFGDYARGGFALSCRLSSGVQVAANNALTYPNNNCGSFGGVRADSSASASLADYYGTMYFSPSSGMTSLNFRPIYYNFDNGGVMDSLQFESVPCYTDGGTVLYFIIICPYIGSSMSGDPPAETTTTETNSGGAVTTGDISVDVNIDLDETNGILGSILSVLSDFVGDILDGIKGLFVPDEDYIENWLDDLIDLFEAKFASSGIDIDPLKNALLDMATYGATTSIRFPGIDLSSCGIPFTIPARAVDLQPFGSPINTYIELSINIAATLAVFNLLFTKIKAILVGERVVEIEGDDE